MRATEFISESTLKLSNNDAAKAWIKKVYDQFQPWPMDNNQRVIVIGGQGEDQQFAWFELVPNPGKQNSVEIKWIGAHPQRQGVGSKALKILQDLAAQDNISLTLFPWDKGTVSQSQLTKFYKKSGFAASKPGSKNMSWSPAALTEFASPKLRMIDKVTYVRTLSSGDSITETVFGHPTLRRQG